ncbi:hypothetical protein IY145_10935 [Methylosinus sp. H3A]|uniref:hypothetical protein n=1 Tax=Methylosinus sp. H3A TaxID=2785786 RepID=UPI0018C21AF2|nr:hypothetical protein [Methylosinus sp. H3A]MBG0809894.1 hypothetical protein [Methylosinus sp. H3A]
MKWFSTLRLPSLVFICATWASMADAECDAVRRIALATGAKTFASATTGDVRLRAAPGDILVYCDRLGFTAYGAAKPASRDFYALVGRAGSALLVGSAELLTKSAERCMQSGSAGGTCPMIGSFFLDCWDGNICRVESAD